MNDFKKNFENLNNDLNNENKNLISILIFGLLIGRLYEKFIRLRKILEILMNKIPKNCCYCCCRRNGLNNCSFILL